MTIVEKHKTSVLCQNEPHVQIKIIANHGPMCKRIKNPQTSSNQSGGRDSDCKMVRFESPSV